jgi:mono/diheme cytochrome c family protein
VGQAQTELRGGSFALGTAHFWLGIAVTAIVLAAAGRRAFAPTGLGCASCHGDLAQGDRGPSLAGGEDSRGSAACTPTACSRRPW